MSALFERAQKTVVMITSVPVTAAELDTATWLNLSCTIKQASLLDVNYLGRYASTTLAAFELFLS
ncbi:hypothetical protein QLG18_15700 [Klebsiella pneumoniae]|nr:hypothetical protein [Klebsiella pneumoniae]WHE66413.1 hypothetical protein QLG18_15700 [Klebsiella pneumoniae]